MKVLSHVSEAKLEDCVIGQYVGDPSHQDLEGQKSYVDDPTVAQGIFVKNHVISEKTRCLCLFSHMIVSSS